MNYSHIIDEVCTGKKTPGLVRQIIPILVRWAKKKEVLHTYSDLSQELGYKNGLFSGIGHQLGSTQNVLDELSFLTGERIPTLNALVNQKGKGVPADGFNNVQKDYDLLSEEERKEEATRLNALALMYDKWDWVLAQLDLKPAICKEDIEEILSGKFRGFGGEGDAHKSLKEYVANHPEVVGAKEKGETEQLLLSGDSLDVWFPESKIAVEVKPASSPNADVLRGIFQCVKYKSVLDAQDAVEGQKPNARVLLIIEGKLSESNFNAAQTLGVEVIDSFKKSLD